MYNCEYYYRRANSPEELDFLYFGGKKEDVLAEWSARNRAREDLAKGKEIIEEDDIGFQEEEIAGKEAGIIGEEEGIFGQEDGIFIQEERVINRNNEDIEEERNIN